MADYVAVPAVDLEQFLQSKRFERTIQRSEVVYIKRSSVDPSLQIKVYTSISDGQSVARASGRDAIRVCCVFDDGKKSFGVGKFPPVFRVHSVQSVLDRLLLRLKEAASRNRDWLGQQAAKEDLRQKALFAQREREQEQAAFKADMERQTLEDSARPVDGPSFEDYAATLEVPF